MRAFAWPLLTISLLLIVPGLDAQANDAALVPRIDASVQQREQGLLGYTVNEHYAVFRRKDEQHPAAEMFVKTTYRKEAGKSYTIVSETGPELLRKILEEVLDSEKRMTQPANRATAVLTSANYEMAVKGSAQVDGRDCMMVTLKPRRTSPYLFNGTIWVDEKNASIVQLEGTSSKSASVLAGPSQVMRQYAPIGGFAMATHAKAVTNSWVLGQTTIKIDYTGYSLQTVQSGTVSESAVQQGR